MSDPWTFSPNIGLSCCWNWNYILDHTIHKSYWCTNNLPLTSAWWKQFLFHTSLTKPFLSLSRSMKLKKPGSLSQTCIKFLHLDWNPLLQTNQWASSSSPNNIKTAIHINMYDMLTEKDRTSLGCSWSFRRNEPFLLKKNREGEEGSPGKKINKRAI